MLLTSSTPSILFHKVGIDRVTNSYSVIFHQYCVRKKLQIHIAEMLQIDWALLEKCFRATGHYWQCVSDTNCRNASERLGTTVHPTMHAGDPQLGCLLEEIRQLCSQMAEPPLLLQICCLYSCALTWPSSRSSCRSFFGGCARAACRKGRVTAALAFASYTSLP